MASSRRIALRLHEDIAFRVLAANNTPDFRTISDFRDHLGALAGLFLQVLELCRKAGLVKLVALDTKMKANASKHQAMSYGRMKEKEAPGKWTSCEAGPGGGSAVRPGPARG